MPQPPSPKAAHAPTPTPTGRSIIEGAFVEAGESVSRAAFRALNPATGTPTGPECFAATPAEIDRAARAAERDARAYASLPREKRAAFLGRIADEILALGEALPALAAAETGLPASPRLASERDRAVLQLRSMAHAVREGAWAEPILDHADPDRKPIPRPDLRRVLVPLGPVAVFGAGNFPIAYSTAGTDTASALAAGCPVVVKGHPGHPGTGELVAQAVTDAAVATGMPTGVFAFLHAGGARENHVGAELVRHPAVAAVGFTGSHAGGMALARLAADRPVPIPVFAEMGSVNPVFLLPAALSRDPVGLAERLFASATASAGQMCTCPGLFFLARGDGADAFLKALASLFHRAEPMVMLSPRVRALYASTLASLAKAKGVEVRAGAAEQPEPRPGSPVTASPALLRTTLAAFEADPALARECFGPAALAVVCDRPDDLLHAASIIPGSLTATIISASPDGALALGLRDLLIPRAGRLISNGVPTGVEVAPAMVHGGPYPATNRPDASAVGPTAIRRWTRPVCFQNFPDELLPHELKDANPLNLARSEDAVYTPPRPSR
ncbi:MAG: aldehyde dehydrogenase (NADP(+)) [Phycisphaeraceae bacterium]|nr:MAG: aldehyde dehydrogenase (NADP(+)) [Phycisphaeraceae bacterium]